MKTVADKLDAASAKADALVDRLDRNRVDATASKTNKEAKKAFRGWGMKVSMSELKRSNEIVKRHNQKVERNATNPLDRIIDAATRLTARMDALEQRRKDAAPTTPQPRTNSGYTGPKDPKAIERLLNARGRNDAASELEVAEDWLKRNLRANDLRLELKQLTKEEHLKAKANIEREAAFRRSRLKGPARF